RSATRRLLRATLEAPAMTRRIVTLREHLGEEFKGVRSRLVRSVRPVFVPDDRGRPELVGSCTLLRIECQGLLSTAAHLINRYSDRYFYVGGAKCIVPIAG